ncbi:MAG: FAD:protein FMN transferase [Prosthecochloris sp.]|uniref:FAD:protein FMN transferase n=1 Tax=Prosthecochloris sp. TaxID=290513 RepID=UPI0013C880F9|nr:FAD:protein FMN transferase [Prosthecochloris sp.]NEX11694.1 FAD:protein FMN transferase [Prosthecochloris sp.]
MRPRYFSFPALFILFLTLLACSGRGDDLRIYEQEKVMMGTIMKIKAVAPGNAEDSTRAAFEAAFGEMSELESELSEWQSASPVSAVNREAGVKSVKVPDAVVTVAEKALEIATMTDGAFDVTFKPVGQLWNVKERTAPPPQDSIATALALVDYRQIRLERANSTLYLAKKGMEIGFGGIGKGYAAWRAGEVLKQHGIRNFIINAGGDLYVEGKKDDRFWTSGIKNPDQDNPKPVTTFNVIATCGVATSGDYENFFTWKSERYHHIIDLKTGYPAKGMKSSTVFSSDPAKADAYATAFFIMGYEKALAVVAEDPSVAFILIDCDNKVMRSPNLGQFIQEH